MKPTGVASMFSDRTAGVAYFVADGVCVRGKMRGNETSQIAL